MKIIFLDFDGVLNHLMFFSKNQRERQIKRNFDSVCPVAVECLNQLTMNSEVQVVISSTWRMGVEEEAKNRCKVALEDAGFIGTIHDDWRTISYNGCIRGDEIEEWLSRHEEVTHWVCLDDDSDFYFENNLVKTNTYLGLTLKEVVQAEKCLGLSKFKELEGLV